MSIANTLSVLLSFKTDLSGLEKFQTGLTSRLKQIQDFNAKIATGTNAVATALQAAAGYFAIGQLKDYTREAVQARTAQGQLAQALKQQKQDSTSYRSELQAQAEALQRTTGVQDEVISGVQRQLVFAKVQRKDIADLTALTLDFAAAKEVDGVSAAKAVGRALQGEGDELKRYGVEVNLAGDKVSALKEGLGKFKGQAATAFAALPEGMRDFSIAAKEAKQSAGEAVLEISSPFLAGIANGLNNVKGKLEEIASTGSFVGQVLRSAATWLGSLVGQHLDKLFILAAAFVAVKSGGFLASEAIGTLAKVFLLLTQQNLLATLAGIQSLSKEVGILQALSIGGWAGKLAVGIAAISGAFLAYTAGATIIQTIASATEARLEAENKIRQTAADQTREYTEQLRLLRSIGDAKSASSSMEQALKKAVAERDALEQKAAKTHVESVGMTSRVAPDGLNADEQARLNDLNQQIFDLAQRYRLAVDSKFVESQINKNVKTDATKATTLTPEQRAARDELELKRQLFDLDTSIKEAELDHNDALVDRLTRERDEVALLQQLGPEAYDVVKARIEAEAEERKKQLERVQLEREIFDLESKAQQAEAANNTKQAEEIRAQIRLKQYKQQLEGGDVTAAQRRVDAEKAVTDAERGRLTLEQALSRQIAANEQAANAVNASKFLTQQEKDAIRLQILRKTNDAITAQIALLERQQQVSPDPTRQGQIDSLRQKKGENSVEIGTLTPLSTSQGFLAGVVQFLSDIPSLAARAQQAVVSIAQAFSGGIASSITGLIERTMTWRDAILNVETAVGTSLLNSFANFVADWITQHVVMDNVRAAFNAMGIADQAAATSAQVGIHAAGEGAKTGITAGNAIARKSITLGETIFHGIQAGIRLAAHTASEIGQTIVTLAQKAIRLPAILAESGAYLIKAAVGAMSAMASIPYVGPILAIAAMAAILAAGASVMGGMADGGIVSGPGGGTDDKVPMRLSNGEAVTRAAVVSRFGPDFFHSLNQGVLDLSTLPAGVAATIPQAAAQTGSVSPAGASAGGAQGGPPIVNVAYFNDESQAMSWLNRQSGQKRLYRNLNQNRDEIGLGS